MILPVTLQRCDENPADLLRPPKYCRQNMLKAQPKQQDDDETFMGIAAWSRERVQVRISERIKLKLKPREGMIWRAESLEAMP